MPVVLLHSLTYRQREQSNPKLALVLQECRDGGFRVDQIDSSPVLARGFDQTHGNFGMCEAARIPASLSIGSSSTMVVG